MNRWKVFHKKTMVYRGNQRCYVRERVLRNFAKFIGKHLCRRDSIWGLQPPVPVLGIEFLDFSSTLNILVPICYRRLKKCFVLQIRFSRSYSSKNFKIYETIIAVTAHKHSHKYDISNYIFNYFLEILVSFKMNFFQILVQHTKNISISFSVRLQRLETRIFYDFIKMTK